MKPNKGQHHDVSLACECGATLKLSYGVTNISAEYDNATVVQAWEVSHAGQGHQRVTCPEARSVRYAERKKAHDRERKRQKYWEQRIAK